MTQNPFKPGDKVRCVDDANQGLGPRCITAGNEYVVKSISQRPGDSFVQLEGVVPVNAAGWLSSRFELVEDSIEVENRRSTMLVLAKFLADDGLSRAEAGAEMAYMVRDRYCHLIDPVLDEVFKPPVLLDLTRGAVSTGVFPGCIRGLAKEFRANAASVRPDDEDDDTLTDTYGEINGAMADVYDECADRVLSAFNLTQEA